MANNIEITLLSSEEYQRYKKYIPPIDSNVWWLRDACPGYDSAACCASNTSPYIVGGIHNETIGVRPVLQINIENNKALQPGDKIRIGSKNFTIIWWDGDGLFALCDECIATRRFDTDSNKWETSELKEWLETEGIKLIF